MELAKAAETSRMQNSANYEFSGFAGVCGFLREFAVFCGCFAGKGGCGKQAFCILQSQAGTSCAMMCAPAKGPHTIHRSGQTTPRQTMEAVPGTGEPHRPPAVMFKL